MDKIKVILLRGMTRDHPITRIAKTLASNGYSVKLLRWDREPHRSRPMRSNNYDDYYFRLKTPYNLIVIIFYIAIWQIYQVYFLIRNDCDIIQAADFDTLIPALFIKFAKRKKLTYIIFDLYGDNFKNYLMRSIFSAIERFAIRFVDILFLVDESRYEQVKSAKIKNLAYIYNSPEDVYSVKYSPICVKSKIIVFYAGYIGPGRGLKEVADAVANLNEIELIIAGTGPDQKLIEWQASYSDNVKYIGLIPYEEVFKRIMGADILFAFYDPLVINNKYASPNKLFEAMMCGKPIIVSDGSSMANIVRKENCGLVVPYGDVHAIRETMIKLKNDSNLMQKLGQNGRKAYEAKYAWTIMEKRLKDAYADFG
jgi:glycosyltransferase involved in cell wall biosynthesis